MEKVLFKYIDDPEQCRIETYIENGGYLVTVDFQQDSTWNSDFLPHPITLFDPDLEDDVGVVLADHDIFKKPPDFSFLLDLPEGFLPFPFPLFVRLSHFYGQSGKVHQGLPSEKFRSIAFPGLATE